MSLFPTVLVELFGVQHFASVNGLLYMIRGVGTLVGTPGAGALIRNREVGGDRLAFKSASALIGVVLTGATVGCLWVRIEAMQRGGSRWIK